MDKKRLHPLAIIFIAAAICLIVTFVILYTVFGLRYINDKTLELKFVGKVEGGVPVSGKLYYYDGRVGEFDAKKKTITTDAGDKYIGALSGYRPHGKGVLTKADGTIFEGDFYEGYCTGQATITYVGGDIYSGEVDHEKREGFGKYVKPDGTVYVGNFKNGEKNGFGKTTFSDGSVYIGEYKDTVKDGKGAYLFAEGDLYVGDFFDDKRTGKGIYLWAKSEEYSTEFDSLFNIEPTDEFESSFLAYFEGDFLRHFRDKDTTDATTTNPFFISFEEILKRSQLELYIGNFLENELSGEGTYRWLSGRVYEGEFEKGVIVREETSETEE